jgi:hypothetical protein
MGFRYIVPSVGRLGHVANDTIASDAI